MIPTYHSLYPSSSSLMEKNEDQCYQRLTPHEASFSSLSRTIILNTDQDHGRSYYKEQEQLQRQEKKSTIWKKEDQAGNQTEHGSAKWIPSKIRMMRKMMNSEQTPSSPMQKFQDHKQPNSSLFDTDHNSRNNISYSSNNSSNMVRVCADCSTTKTPLWRSGPKGPKSLCNACGIRQRKARRAAMAAAEANGTVLGADKKPMKYKVQRKEKRSSTESFIKPFKKRFKVKAPSREEKKIAFEDFTLSLSNKHSGFQQVFPQDEREAAILLMALSHGLVHG